MVELRDEPQLPQFYSGRHVLITGATGFMGKVLVERLLWTCPDVGRLHLLIRDKRGHSPHKRLATLKQSQIFDNVRARNPRLLDKLLVVSGDVSQPCLGLDNEAVSTLREVSIVFHSAATLKFDEPLSVAIEQNVRSVDRLLDLCDKLPNMEAFIHVSTAYSNAELTVVEERVYPPPRPLQQVYALVDTVPEELLAQITQQYISPKPNTYVFSKCLAEQYVLEHSLDEVHYSLAIYRPSIVVSAHKSPFPGWVEGLSGATGVLVAIGQGVMRVFNIGLDERADLVPVDVAVDNMIAVAWETATERPAVARVYNCSSQERPVSWRQFRSAMLRHVRLHPFDNVLYYPHSTGVRNRYLYKCLELLVQTIPLYLAEFVRNLLRVDASMSLITVAQRLSSMSRVLHFFTCQEWTVRVDNLRRLRDKLQQTDGHLYHLDINVIDWEQHTSEFVRGARYYLLRQHDDTLPHALARMERLRWLHRLVMVLLTLFTYKLLRVLVQRHLAAKIGTIHLGMLLSVRDIVRKLLAVRLIN